MATTTTALTRATRLLALALTSFALSAQIPSRPPEVLATGNAANMKQAVPGGLVTLYGSGFSDSAAAASRLPLATMMNGTVVEVCEDIRWLVTEPEPCRAVQLIYVSPNQINFLYSVPPPDRTTTRMMVRVTNHAIKGQKYPIGYLHDVYPAIFHSGFDCPIGRDACSLKAASDTSHTQPRGAVTDASGRLVTSANPIRTNQPYTLWLTGLGLISQAGHPRVVVFPAGSAAESGKSASVLYAGRSSEYPGLDQINFTLPESTFKMCEAESTEFSLAIRSTTKRLGGTSTLISEPITVPVAKSMTGCR